MSRDALLDLDITAGTGGINRSKNLINLPPTDLTYADGITIERDLWEKLPGASKINTAALPILNVLGTWDFISAAGVQELLAYLDDGVNGKLVTMDATGILKTLFSGLTTGGFPWFAEGWDGTTRAVYIWNGKDLPMVYNGGANAIAIPSPNADWSAGNMPTAGAPNGVRMASWGNANFPHQLYITTSAGHSDYTSGDSAIQRIYPGEGYAIVGGLFWRDKFYIGKKLGIYYLDSSDPSIANWVVQRVTQSFGIAGPGCMIDTENDVVMLGSDGYFYSLSQVQTLGEVNIPPLLPLETGQFLKEQLNTSRLDLVRAIWFGYKRQIWWAVPIGNSTVCNALIIMDMHSQVGARLLYTSRDICPGLSLRRSAGITSVRKPCFGDNAGFVWQADQAARNKDGAGYTAQYECPPVALFPGGKRRGNLEELIVTQDPQGNWDVTIEVQRDGQVGQTLAFSQATPGAPVGSISLDSDVLAGQTITNVKHRLEGDCRFIKLIGRNNNANQNFAVMNHKVRYTPGNER